ncbi:MAG: hypothetical protein KGL90_05610 [Burkholderiales bacterium]|nr:hypothetical protein [Burkholderiales bacterium]
MVIAHAAAPLPAPDGRLPQAAPTEQRQARAEPSPAEGQWLDEAMKLWCTAPSAPV